MQGSDTYDHIMRIVKLKQVVKLVFLIALRKAKCVYNFGLSECNIWLSIHE